MVSSVPGGDASFTPSGPLRAVPGTRFADVRWVAETGSTNADLLALATAGRPEGTVLVADHQTAGRGRLGRVWTAPPGASILLSVLLRPDVGLEHAHALTTAVALSAIEACETVAGVRPGLKWPNDLVVAVPAADGAERKLAGVLAESVLAGRRFAAVVVGIGLNVNWPDDLPPEIADLAVALNHLTGGPVDRQKLVTALLVGLERRYAALLAPDGRMALRREEEAVSATLGRDVRVVRSHDELVGTVVGFEPDGALRLEVDTDVVVVPVGDVIHLRPGSSSVGAASPSGAPAPLPASGGQPEDPDPRSISAGKNHAG